MGSDGEIIPVIEYCISDHMTIWLAVIYAYKGLLLVSRLILHIKYNVEVFILELVILHILIYICLYQCKKEEDDFLDKKKFNKLYMVRDQKTKRPKRV